jgi:hypothetical protein
LVTVLTSESLITQDGGCGGRNGDGGSGGVGNQGPCSRVVRVRVLFGIVVTDGVVASASLLRMPRMWLPLQMLVLNLAGRDDCAPVVNRNEL